MIKKLSWVKCVFRLQILGFTSYVPNLSFWSLTYFVARNRPLPRAFETLSQGLRVLGVFGTPSLYPRPPTAPGGGVELPAHEGNHLLFRKSKLHRNSLEGSAVLPGHFDDAVGIFCGKIRWYVFAGAHTLYGVGFDPGQKILIGYPDAFLDVDGMFPAQGV